MKPHTDPKTGTTTAIVEPTDEKAFANVIDRLLQLIVIEHRGPQVIMAQEAIASLRAIGWPWPAPEETPADDDDA